MKHEVETPHVADMKMTVEGLLPKLGRGFTFAYLFALALIVILIPVMIFIFVFQGEL